MSTVIVTIFVNAAHTHAHHPLPQSVSIANVNVHSPHLPFVQCHEKLPHVLRVFNPVQSHEPSQFAPSVWAPSVTTSANALPSCYGMEKKPGVKEMSKDASSTPQESLYALTGSGQMDVQHPPTTMNAQAVESQIMELKNVLKHRRINVLMPYKANVWEQLLNQYGLADRYPFLPFQI